MTLLNIWKLEMKLMLKYGYIVFYNFGQAETLINEENMIPCFDIVSIMCDQLNGRLKSINKFGAPKDMS